MGNVTPIKAGGQIAYRLTGSRDVTNAQLDYRMGLQTDARQVVAFGRGETAQQVGLFEGQQVDGSTARDLKVLLETGANPVTGEVLAAPIRRAAPASKVSALPAVEAIEARAAQRGVAAAGLFQSQTSRRDWMTLSGQAHKKGEGYQLASMSPRSTSRNCGIRRWQTPVKLS